MYRRIWVIRLWKAVDWATILRRLVHFGASSASCTITLFASSGPFSRDLTYVSPHCRHMHCYSFGWCLSQWFLVDPNHHICFHERQWGCRMLLKKGSQLHCSLRFCHWSWALLRCFYKIFSRTQGPHGCLSWCCQWWQGNICTPQVPSHRLGPEHLSGQATSYQNRLAGRIEKLQLLLSWTGHIQMSPSCVTLGWWWYKLVRSPIVLHLDL